MTRIFANAESPINYDTAEEVGEANIVVLKDHHGEDIFISVQEATTYASAKGMRNPFTGGTTAYSAENAEILRNDPRTSGHLASVALCKALQAEDESAQGNLPAARKLLAEALELAPGLPEALTLQSALTPPSPRPRSPRSLNGPGPFPQPAVAAQLAAPAPLPPAARASGIDPSDFQALRVLEQALRNDTSDDFTESQFAMADYAQQTRLHTPERLRAIDGGIKVYGHPFGEALHACRSGQRLRGHRLGPDALGFQLGQQLQQLGFALL